jgi:CHRD domain
MRKNTMKKALTLVVLIIAAMVAAPLHAQSRCAATDPHRLAAVLTGNATGHASFLIDRDTDRLSYRVDVSRLSEVTGVRLQHAAGGDVVELLTPDQSVAGGVLQGTIAVSAALLDELYANPGAFTLSVATTAGARMSGRLNGRGTVLMAGTLSMSGGGASAKVRTDVASNATGIFSLGFVDDDPSGSDVRVDFDVMTDSIDGMDTTSLVLVGDDGSFEDILDLVSVQGFTGGRLHGSVRLSRDELERIVENPSGYQLQFRSPNDGLFSGELREATTTFIPAFGRAQNASGHAFSSDLRLYNPGSEPANVFIQFFPSGATEPLAGSATVIRLEPGQSRVIADAVPTLFGHSAAMGSLRVVSSGPVVADSELGGGSGPMGQFIGGLSACSAVTDGVLTSLAASQSANGFRTNILLGNPGPYDAVAHFELRDELGRLLDERLLTLPAHGQTLMPLGHLFRNAPASLRNATLTMHADTPLYVGASIVQNATGEGRFHAARDISR